MSKFLVINFGDNDFYNSLKALGEWVLEEIDEDTIAHMIEEGSVNDILTQMFRNMLCLHQQSFDMYKDFGNKDEVLSCCKDYMESDYFILEDAKISLVEEWVPEWNNSEVLVVDYGNKQIYIV
ncbi:hypothetical protein NVP1121O_003 [Vibrio phage 1.121.O._10N.286.46.C4]|nr:hypothetical protein NVP1121O_003 [Vibrio phage 1.121.O._10N.286.46.C4]